MTTQPLDKSISDNRRNHEIDVLRGIAILMVIWHHSGAIFPWSVKTSPDFVQGWAGVELFFVISGYVVSASLLPSFEKAAKWLTIKKFYIKRFFRLAPVCWFWLLLASCILFVLNDQQSWMQQIHDFGKNFFVISTYWYNFWIVRGGHSSFDWHWSLAIEEQFYLFFPVFLLIFRSRLSQILSLSCFVIAINFVVRPFWLHTGAPDWPIYRISTILKIDSIMLGVLIYLLKLKINQRIASTWVMLFVNASSLATVFVLPYFLNVYLPAKYLAINIGATLLVQMASQKAQLITPIPYVSKVLEYIGKRSYGLYLCHVPLIWANHVLWLPENLQMYFGQSTNICLFTYLALILTCSELSFRYIEMPSMAFGHKLASAKV